MSTDERQGAAVAGAGFIGLHGEITDRVPAVYFAIYNEMGGGFLESCYQHALKIALLQAGPMTEVEVAVPVYFRGQAAGTFRADLIVNDVVLLELKAVSILDREHDGQILHYLRATELEVGLLLNFSPRPQFKGSYWKTRTRRSVSIRSHPRPVRRGI